MNTRDHSGTFRRPEDELPAPRILIVDDKPAHASAAKRALRNPSSNIGRLEPEIDVVEDLATARQYLEEDSIDIYILDLEIAERAGEGLLDISVGTNFVMDVVQATNAGIVICSAFAAETEAAKLLEVGADDYVEKAYGLDISAASVKDVRGLDIFAARVYSVWRRTLQSRRDASKTLKFAHVGRTFSFSGWQFVVGSRTLTNNEGAEIRLSPTEHAFLRYLLTVDGHSIDSEIFNIEVLDRDQHKTPIRLDNFVYRIRKKFHDRIELASQGNGIYKMLDIRELKLKAITTMPPSEAKRRFV
jgi:two-component system, OmpR family, KDP operon response regulator KdpE